MIERVDPKNQRSNLNYSIRNEGITLWFCEKAGHCSWMRFKL